MADKSVSTESLAMDTGKPRYEGKKLRVAIIGCGGIAQTHLNSYLSIPEVEIVAGVDIVPDRLKVMQEKWNVKAVYTDWRKMLKEVKPDAVDVCTPNGAKTDRVELHREYLKFCGRAGEQEPLANKAFFDRMRREPGVDDARWLGSDRIAVRDFKGIGLSFTSPQGRSDDTDDT